MNRRRFTSPSLRALMGSALLALAYATVAERITAQTRSAALADIADASVLRAQFNRDRGAIRLVLLLSPTWPACVKGARWVQDELLVPNAGAPLRVYAVWYNMFPGDSRGHWRADLLTDARVAHYWDEPRAVGRLYFQNLPRMWEKRVRDTVLPQDVILWDAYLLYGGEARWDQQPPDVISWGSTILLTRDGLKRDLDALLKR